MDKITVNYQEKPCYDIILEDDFSELGNILADIDSTNRKICIVTDSTVGPIYLNEVIEQLHPFAKDIITYTFKAGESSKTLDVIYEIYEQLIMNHFERKDILVALGGGVVGDMTGYTAATYLRGIRFVQVPTTLLSMVDSSIGGKTGVDFKAYKNMIGAFHQPSAVYMNLSTLNTLTKEQYTSGIGEIVKHALIKNSEYYQWLREHCESILLLHKDIVRTMIIKSLNIKKEVVEKDPKEQGERALLNFGHTLGHAIEKHMNFTMLHGDCIAVGSIAASYISYLRGHISKDILLDIEEVMKEFNLPIRIAKMNSDDLLNTTKSDKKMEAGTIKFILINRIGDAFIDTTVTKDEMKKALEYVMTT